MTYEQYVRLTKESQQQEQFVANKYYYNYYNLLWLINNYYRRSGTYVHIQWSGLRNKNLGNRYLDDPYENVIIKCDGEVLNRKEVGKNYNNLERVDDVEEYILDGNPGKYTIYISTMQFTATWEYSSEFKWVCIEDGPSIWE